VQRHVTGRRRPRSLVLPLTAAACAAMRRACPPWRRQRGPWCTPPRR
jgi:hypothetical protein